MDLSAFFFPLCLLFRRAHRHPFPIPSVARSGHLLVGAQNHLARLSQIHMAIAAGGLHYIPQVGDSVPLAICHRAGNRDLRLWHRSDRASAIPWLSASPSSRA